MNDLVHADPLPAEQQNGQPGVQIDYLGGNCPVQAEGTIDGEPFYFRARGQRWSFSIGDLVNPGWLYDEPWGNEPYAAGWMEPDEAQRMIEKAVSIYRASPNEGKASE